MNVIMKSVTLVVILLTVVVDGNVLRNNFKDMNSEKFEERQQPTSIADFINVIVNMFKTFVTQFFPNVTTAATSTTVPGLSHCYPIPIGLLNIVHMHTFVCTFNSLISFTYLQIQTK